VSRLALSTSQLERGSVGRCSASCSFCRREPCDPAASVVAIPDWSVGDVITLGAGEQLRVPETQPEITQEQT
jgi:hypothetical protein